MRALTLPVAPLPDADSRRRPFTAPRTLSTDSAPTPPLSRSEVPSTDGSRPPYSFAGAESTAWWAATGTSALPLWPSVRRAFTRLYELDPLRRAGYSPELGGHAPPIDFCSCQEFRTRPRTVRLRLHTSRRNESRRAGDSRSLRRRPAECSQLRGRCTSCEASQPPRRRPLRLSRIYPNLFQLRHPLSLVDTGRGSEKASTGDPTEVPPPPLEDVESGSLHILRRRAGRCLEDQRAGPAPPECGAP